MINIHTFVVRNKTKETDDEVSTDYSAARCHAPNCLAQEHESEPPILTTAVTGNDL